MKSIGTNALRPTAESLKRFFTVSGKSHLILTGGRGSGKSTLLNELLSLLSDSPIPGITTWVQAETAVYIKDNLTNNCACIGIYDKKLSGAENKMHPITQGFLDIGVPAINNGLSNECDWFFIDEIGYLESACEKYCGAITNIMKHKRLVAAVRKQSLPFLDSLCCREDVCLVDLDKPFGKLGCVIMASGMSKRFGSNKLLADFGGKHLIEHILDTAKNIFDKQVVVTRHKDIADICSTVNIPIVLHNEPYRSDTVRLGLEALGCDITGCMFCPADQPLLSSETLMTMALSASVFPDFIWQLSYGDTVGAPVIFPRSLFDELRSLPQGLGGSSIIKKHPELVRYIPARDKYELMDIDTQEDLKFLLNELYPFS